MLSGFKINPVQRDVKSVTKLSSWLASFTLLFRWLLTDHLISDHGFDIGIQIALGYKVKLNLRLAIQDVA